MSDSPGAVLKSRVFYSWSLFWLVTGPVSFAMLVAVMGNEVNSGQAVSSLIQLSVR